MGMDWSGSGFGAELESLLHLTIENFETDRKHFWSGVDRGDKLLEFMDEIAKTLTVASTDLTSQTLSEHLFSWDQLRHLAELDGFREPVFEGIQISVALEFCTDSHVKAQRCLELIEEVVQDQPSKTVMEYMRRLSRCYIAGLGPECVIICRGVLENAIRDRFRRAKVPLPATPEGRSSMRVRIDAAHRLGFLSTAGKSSATVVWTRGSKAAHEDVNVTKDILGTVRMTMSVLRELYPG